MNQHNAFFIIAGNRKEYQQWVKNRTDLHSKIMVPQTFLGCKDISGYFVGSFRNREDIVDILRLDATK